jgi:SAM-dependent methyltransferase
LGFRDGDRILDLGCGPGTYLSILSHQVGGRGSVVGLDNSPDAVQAARARLAAGPIPNWSVVEGDIRDPDLADVFTERFDCILLFNTAMYLEDLEKIIGCAANLLSDRGSIIIKDIDMSQIFLSWVSDTVKHRVIEGARAATGLNIDDFCGGRLLPRHTIGPLSVVDRFVWSYVFTTPFTEQEVQYLTRGFTALGESAQPHVESATSHAWLNAVSAQGLHLASQGENAVILYDLVMRLSKRGAR